MYSFCNTGFPNFDGFAGDVWAPLRFSCENGSLAGAL